MGVWYKHGVVIPPNTTDLNGGVSFSGTSNPSALYEGSPQLISANPDGKVFKMWFQGANNTYYAESNDGISWTRKTAAILTGLGLPKIFKNGGTYFMYVNPSPALTSIAAYTSTDGVNFTLQNASALLPGTTGTWDSSQLYYLCPVFIDGNGTWHGLYSGFNNTAPASTGLITSSDGLTWTKFGSNPVAVDYIDLEPHIINNIYYAWGSTTIPGQGGATPFVDPQDLIRAQSSDLINWTKITNIPRTQTYEGTGSANGEIAVQSLVEANGKTYSFYTASPDGTAGLGYQICLAIANMPMAALVQGNEGMAISFIQSPVPANFVSAASFAKVFVSNNTAGNMLIVGLYVASTGLPASISDTLGNIWVPATPQVFSTQTLQYWYVLNCKGGANTVTVNLNSAASGAMIIAEYAGVNKIDVASGANGSGTALNSGNVTTANTNELLLGFLASFQGTLGSVAVGTGGAGTTIRQNIQTSFALADNVVTVTGTYAASATDVSGAWAADIVTFYSNPVFSYPDDRSFGNFPNNSVTVQGTLLYVVPKPDSRATPNIPVDSRVSPNIPVDSRASGNAPQNSRNTPS